MYKRFIKPHFTVGSIIKRVHKNSIVWGSGIIKHDEEVAEAKFLAVRGPRTRKRLLELGYDVPKKYGDPAVLLADIIDNTVEQKYELGIIPHYLDYEAVYDRFKNEPRIKVIALETNDVVSTTFEILECEAIVSSSLHGIVVPQCFKILALWVIFSEKLSGDNTKFYDYFESVEINYAEPIICDVGTLELHGLNVLLNQHQEVLLPKPDLIEARKKDLRETSPF